MSDNYLLGFTTAGNIAMNEKNIAKAGKLLCVGSGEYSDYQVTGFFVVLRDFAPLAELAEYLEANPEQKDDYSFEKYKFLSHLLAKGLLLELDYGTLFAGSYNDASSVTFTPAK